MAISDLTRKTKVNIPFLGEKEINIPLVIGGGLVAAGALWFFAPTLFKGAEKVTNAQAKKDEAEAALKNPGITPQEREKYEQQLVQANDQLRIEQEKQAVSSEKIQAEQAAANNPPVPHGSVIYGSIAIYSPYFSKEASTDQWKALLGLIELNCKENYYRGDGMYYGNESGEILPARGIIKEVNLFIGADWDVKSLAQFIASGGVWIDYTDYPLYFADGYLIIPDYSNKTRFNRFCTELSKLTTWEINKLGAFSNVLSYQLYSYFWVRDKFLEFPYERALTILKETPPKDYFVTSNMIAGLEHVPYDPRGAYSMFAIRYRNGIYFYSNRGNSPYDYATFIKAVHNFQV